MSQAGRRMMIQVQKNFFFVVETLSFGIRRFVDVQHLRELSHVSYLQVLVVQEING